MAAIPEATRRKELQRFLAARQVHTIRQSVQERSLPTPPAPKTRRSVLMRLLATPRLAPTEVVQTRPLELLRSLPTPLAARILRLVMQHSPKATAVPIRLSAI